MPYLKRTSKNGKVVIRKSNLYFGDGFIIIMYEIEIREFEVLKKVDFVWPTISNLASNIIIHINVVPT